MRYYHTEEDNLRENDFVNSTGALKMSGYANTTRTQRHGCPADEHDKDFSRTLKDTAPKYYEQPAPVKQRTEKLDITFNLRPQCKTHTTKFAGVGDLTVPEGPVLATAGRVQSIAKRYDRIHKEQDETGRISLGSTPLNTQEMCAQVKPRKYNFNSMQQDIGAGNYSVHQTTCVQNPVLKTKNPQTSYWTPCGDIFEN
ncbi:hypothetical protein GL50803_003934 [Giardia duodenalis]|uniref:Uncharacterized protein n=1 Tax=Giardia intestinalis (strain ATCC 50803 / WB clone C6) TaxID=184922 RepID=A8B7W2_GIAIC|nr:hypothetical protein GL50803_003934 [Giardia intestinalis]KAE8305390.1 hypothetical protein GL50803_003934 [Giardia intestinalis]|eukprot:XP_001708892.1 Hypothetical protein GL50803_3934 [Giardia lamblia ATCC 50803]